MPYTEAQLHTVEQLITALGWEYPIGEVVAHHDIAPGRKIDTTPLMDWPRMRAALESGGGNEQAEANATVPVGNDETKPAVAPPPQPPVIPRSATPPGATPPVATSFRRWPVWKIPLISPPRAVSYGRWSPARSTAKKRNGYQHLVQ
jgi:hypothetical protein